MTILARVVDDVRGDAVAVHIDAPGVHVVVSRGLQVAVNLMLAGLRLGPIRKIPQHFADVRPDVELLPDVGRERVVVLTEDRGAILAHLGERRAHMAVA